MRINSYVSALVAAAHLQLASADPVRCARQVGGGRVHDPCGHRILPQVAVNTEAPASSVPTPVTASRSMPISPAHPTGTVGATYSGPYYNYPKAEEWKHFDELVSRFCSIIPNSALLAAATETNNQSHIFKKATSLAHSGHSLKNKLSRSNPYACQFDSFRPTMQVHSTPGAVDRLRISISKIGPEFGIPENFILAIVMVESRGDVGVGDAWDGQPTYGLMQAWGCPGYPGQHDLNQVCGP